MKIKFKMLRLLFATALVVFPLSMSVKGNVGNGACGIYADFAVLKVNGGSQNWYQAQNGSAFPASLGNVTSLTLTGGEVDTYKNGSGNILGAYLDYRIYSGSPSGSFTEIALPHQADNYFGAGNQQWETANIPSTTGVNIDVLSLNGGLTYGTTYTLEFYWRARANDGGTDFDWTDNQGGANYTMTLTPVPEPITLALPIFGGLVLTAGVARRFVSRRTNPLV